MTPVPAVAAHPAAAGVVATLGGRLDQPCTRLRAHRPTRRAVDGRTVLEAIRRRGERMPVIILSARSGIEDTLGGLEGGADDYVTKPFRFEELLARVRARLRDQGSPDATQYEVDDLELDMRIRRVQVHGREAELSSREYALLELFMRHPGQVLSRQQILAQVWGYDHDPGSNVVDVYVGYLRRKVGRDRIETVRGMGYRLRADG